MSIYLGVLLFCILWAIDDAKEEVKARCYAVTFVAVLLSIVFIEFIKHL